VSEHIPLRGKKDPNVFFDQEAFFRDHEPRPPRVLPLRYFPDPILHKKCEPIPEVTQEIRQLSYDMILTMMKGEGIGLAAPQVGRAIQLFVADIEWPERKVDSRSYVFINPTVEPIGPTIKSVEGCLSFPGERFEEKRVNKVKVKAIGLDGQPFEMEAEDTLAVVIQHEMDHLNGWTVASNLSWMKRDLLKKAILKRLRNRR